LEVLYWGGMFTLFFGAPACSRPITRTVLAGYAAIISSGKRCLARCWLASGAGLASGCITVVKLDLAVAAYMAAARVA